jgi:hypothetical protein
MWARVVDGMHGVAVADDGDAAAAGFEEHRPIGAQGIERSRTDAWHAATLRRSRLERRLEEGLYGRDQRVVRQRFLEDLQDAGAERASGERPRRTSCRRYGAAMLGSRRRA